MREQYYYYSPSQNALFLDTIIGYKADTINGKAYTEKVTSEEKKEYLKKWRDARLVHTKSIGNRPIFKRRLY